MENTEIKYQWLILDKNTISELDYKLWSEWTDIKIPKNTNTERRFYNQWKSERTGNWCWLFWSAWAVSDLTWYKFSIEELLDIVNLAEKWYGRTEKWWMYMSKAIDCVRAWRNKKFPKNKITSFRTTIWSEIFKEWLNKNHTFVVWYRTSKEYYKDSQDDWIISWEDFPKNWWHLVRTNLNTVIKIDDNYFWTKKHNTYTNNKIKKLVDNWVFFPSAYLFLKDTTMKDEIRDNIDLEKAKEMFDLWYWNGLSPRQSMSRQEVMTVLWRILDEIKNSY